MLKLLPLLKHLFICAMFIVSITHGQDISVKQQMDEMTQKAKIKWSYNPFAVSLEEKRMVGWQDPYAFITRFWVGDNLSAGDMHPFALGYLDNASVFYSPTIATELYPISFSLNRFKFNVGVGVLVEINMAQFMNDYRQKYGNTHIMSYNIQLDVFLEVFIDNVWKFRWTPMRHMCQHLFADITADPDLFDQDTVERIDSGTEGMAFQLFYNYGWATFYGGAGFTYRDVGSTFYTSFSTHIGTDVRVPIWGEINFISGFYVAAERDVYSEDGTKTVQWNPLFSVGLGIEIERITYGFKYLRIRSRQMHSQHIIEERIGAEFTILY